MKSIITVLCLIAAQSAFAQVKENTWTTPDNGVAGINDVNVSGTGFPNGTITPSNVVISLAATCGGTPVATTTAISVRAIIGSSKRVDFQIPATLATGTYYVSLSDSAAGDAHFTNATCSAVNVTHSNSTLAACLPSSSLGVLVPSTPGKVTAYVPNASWELSSTGIQVVDLEGGTSKTSISTPNPVNSCSSNPATGQTVCTANTTDVYLISGTALTNTLTSGATGSASFSGGSCENCGVAINALSNKALINIGLSASPTGSGVQLLDLNTNTFSTPVNATTGVVSENPSIDPTRNLILSASENNTYTLFQIQSDGTTLKEFGSASPTDTNGSAEADSSGEDCSTGIAIAPMEFTNDVYLADLTQATFTPGSPAGTWNAPNSTTTLVTNYTFSAGLSGVSVAVGTSHLAVVTGEFGGNTFAVLQLPSKSGSGTPNIVDYAVAQIPDSAVCGGSF